MTSFSSIITLAAVLLFARLHLFQSSVNALPLQGTTGSGSMLTESDLEPTTVDCSAPTVTATTELGSARRGLLVLRDYADNKYSKTREFQHGSGSRTCRHAVLFKTEVETLIFDHEIVNTNSGRLVADWYSIIVTIDEYLASLTSKPLLYPTDNATMQTLSHVLTAVKQDLLSTLQSLRCNCTSECSIVKKEMNTDARVHSCPDQLNFLHKTLRIIAQQAANAVTETEKRPCCSITPVNETEWIEDNVPATSPDYDTLVKLSNRRG